MVETEKFLFPFVTCVSISSQRWEVIFALFFIWLVGCWFWGDFFGCFLGVVLFVVFFFNSGYTFIPTSHLMCRPKNWVFYLKNKMDHLLVSWEFGLVWVRGFIPWAISGGGKKSHSFGVLLFILSYIILELSSPCRNIRQVCMVFLLLSLWMF